jgi:hypothetical protein
MDRRRFLQTLISTAPALTPLVLAAKQTHHSGELYLISDEPQGYLPALLGEAEAFQPIASRTFAFLTPHPRGPQLRAGLMGQGWSPAADSARALLTLSFSPLSLSSRPSFTFVREGRIWDIRSRRLRSLWDRMGRHSAPSASLTIAGFQPDPHAQTRGEVAALYHQGRLKDRIPLDRPGRRILSAPGGRLVVQVLEGRARVVESPCRSQICRCTPPISLTGERIICAPNHVLLEILGPGGLDAVIG